MAWQIRQPNSIICVTLVTVLNVCCGCAWQADHSVLGYAPVLSLVDSSGARRDASTRASRRTELLECCGVVRDAQAFKVPIFMLLYS
jgi:hypothetical protein